MIRYPRRGFTLVEIMIVVAIIAIILAIVIPNFMKAGANSAKNACIANLKQIDGAIDEWAFDKSITSGAIPTGDQISEIYSYVDGGIPVCPSKGEYTIYSVDSVPQARCSREGVGHKLPE